MLCTHCKANNIKPYRQIKKRFCSISCSNASRKTNGNEIKIYKKYAIVKIVSKGIVYKVNIDKEDVCKIKPFKWYISRGYARAFIGGKNRIYMHKLLKQVSPNFFNDHINRNRLDNRKCNLREVSRLENNRNRTFNTKKHDK